MVHNSYEYYQSQGKNIDYTVWRCANGYSKKLSCNVCAHTKKFNSIEWVKILGAHKHAPDEGLRRKE